MLVALIPARAGSKSIKNKNWVSLKGKPLISYTIEAAVRSSYIQKIIVSSNASEIASICEQYPSIVYHQRTEALSQDYSLTFDAIEDVIKSFNLNGEDIIILLQPTSPFRTYEHIDKACELFFRAGVESLISVNPMGVSPYKAFKKMDNGLLEPLFTEVFAYMPRQLLPETFAPNGAIYIFSVESALKYGQIPSRGIFPYVMDEKASLDIDVPSDLDRAEIYSLVASD